MQRQFLRTYMYLEQEKSDADKTIVEVLLQKYLSMSSGQ